MKQIPPTYQPLLRIALAAGSGIILDRWLNWPLDRWLVLSIVAAAGWAGLKHLGLWQATSVAFVLAVTFLGGTWHHAHWNLYGQTDIASFATDDPAPTILRGKVVGGPARIASDSLQQRFTRARGERSRVLIQVDSIRDGGNFRSATGRVELYADGVFTDINLGDRVEIAGKLVRIKKASNPGQFDFHGHYRRLRTLCWMNVDAAGCVQKIGQGNIIARTSSRIRRTLDGFFWRYLPDRTASLASAMLLGNREQLDRSTRDQFMLSGTVHLLAISGLHVGFLASFVFLPARLGLLSRRQGLWATILFVVLYTWLVQFRPPVIRAAVLISTYCFCQLTGRSPFSFNSLALAALIVLAYNPTELFASGAQLSFLAVGTIVYGQRWVVWPESDDPIDRLLARKRPAWKTIPKNLSRKAFTAFAISGVIWIFAMPAVAYQFHLVAPVALVANPVLLVPIAAALFFGLGLLLLGWFPPVAQLMSSGCHLALESIRVSVDFFHQVPGSHWWTAGPPLWSVLVFYTLVLIAFLRFNEMTKRTFAIALGCWLLLGWLVPDWHHQRQQQQRDDLRCTIADVGHGGCVLIQGPNGKNILYDCGSFGSPRNAQRIAAGILWNQRIRHLDAVVISHADSDHFNGLPLLSQQFSIGQVIVTDRFLHQAPAQPAAAELLKELDKNGVTVTTVSAKDHLETGSPVSIRVLNPPTSGFESTDNANSIVLEIEYYGRRILLTGDIEKEGLETLLNRPTSRFDAVTAPHHGSRNSRPAEFLRWSDPKVVVISSGRGRNTSLREFAPDKPIAEYHTGYQGAIQIVVQPDSIDVQAWNKQPW